MSDAIKLHLQRDLTDRRVAVNREVEVRPSLGGAAGERTDIHVVALTAETADPITVIIEVKGGWHPDVNDAMRIQLRDRYIANNRVTHGVYVVVWFRCPQWDTNDQRRASHRRLLGERIEVARQTFDAQANDLSQPPIVMRVVILDASLR